MSLAAVSSIAHSPGPSGAALDESEEGKPPLRSSGSLQHMRSAERLGPITFSTAESSAENSPVDPPPTATGSRPRAATALSGPRNVLTLTPVPVGRQVFAKTLPLDRPAQQPRRKHSATVSNTPLRPLPSPPMITTTSATQQQNQAGPSSAPAARPLPNVKTPSSSTSQLTPPPNTGRSPARSKRQRTSSGSGGRLARAPGLPSINRPGNAHTAIGASMDPSHNTLVIRPLKSPERSNPLNRMRSPEAAVRSPERRAKVTSPERVVPSGARMQSLERPSAPPIQAAAPSTSTSATRSPASSHHTPAFLALRPEPHSHHVAPTRPTIITTPSAHPPRPPHSRNNSQSTVLSTVASPTGGLRLNTSLPASSKPQATFASLAPGPSGASSSSTSAPPTPAKSSSTSSPSVASGSSTKPTPPRALPSPGNLASLVSSPTSLNTASTNSTTSTLRTPSTAASTLQTPADDLPTTARLRSALIAERRSAVRIRSSTMGSVDDENLIGIRSAPALSSADKGKGKMPLRPTRSTDLFASPATPDTYRERRRNGRSGLGESSSELEEEDEPGPGPSPIEPSPIEPSPIHSSPTSLSNEDLEEGIHSHPSALSDMISLSSRHSRGSAQSRPTSMLSTRGGRHYSQLMFSKRKSTLSDDDYTLNLPEEKKVEEDGVEDRMDVDEGMFDDSYDSGGDGGLSPLETRRPSSGRIFSEGEGEGEEELMSPVSSRRRERSLSPIRYARRRGSFDSDFEGGPMFSDEDEYDGEGLDVLGQPKPKSPLRVRARNSPFANYGSGEDDDDEFNSRAGRSRAISRSPQASSPTFSGISSAQHTPRSPSFPVAVRQHLNMAYAYPQVIGSPFGIGIGTGAGEEARKAKSKSPPPTSALPISGMPSRSGKEKDKDKERDKDEAAGTLGVLGGAGAGTAAGGKSATERALGLGGYGIKIPPRDRDRERELPHHHLREERRRNGPGASGGVKAAARAARRAKSVDSSGSSRATSPISRSPILNHTHTGATSQNWRGYTDVGGGIGASPAPSKPLDGKGGGGAKEVGVGGGLITLGPMSMGWVGFRAASPSQTQTQTPAPVEAKQLPVSVPVPMEEVVLDIKKEVVEEDSS